MHPILFKIGPITIYTYGVLVFLGVVAGYFFSLVQVKKEGIDKKDFSDIVFWSLIWGFIGARIFYILLNFKFFLRDPLGIGLSRAGFVFYGGVFFGLGAFYILTRKRNLDFLKLADILVLALLLGHAIGRIGCFSYGCCYGKPTSSWIGIKFPPSSPAGSLGTKVIPTQLISSLALLCIFLVLWSKRKKTSFKGEIFSLYFILYGIFRFIIEFYRGDPRSYLGKFSMFQIISLGMIVIGALLWLLFQKRFKSSNS
ncbi:MAG: prolipoprotein diacylglyceryl transferase [Candidatus Omnitrophica bacterium]|nr:prolipoprotein diacylglyceryl transferase [Candidatus Omnitrophota bacterium]